MYRKHYLLSAEMRQYPENFVAIADHSFRKCYSGKNFADCQTYNMRTYHSRQKNNHPVEAGSAVEADFDHEKQKDSCQTAETAESADQTAHMPFA